MVDGNEEREITGKEHLTNSEKESAKSGVIFFCACLDYTSLSRSS